MIGITYLFVLIFSIFGMSVLDKRFRLAFFDAPRQAAITILIGTLFFLLWDMLGIGFGIFLNGNSQLTTGIMLAPELPLEELFFLFFLCYFTLIVYRLMEAIWLRT